MSPASTPIARPPTAACPDETAMTPEMLELLESSRRAEKAQALFYRRLAARAESAGDEPLSERLQQLHADEQHHLSRLTARLLELGRSTPDPGDDGEALPALEAWEPVARAREHAEIDRYEALLAASPDATTAALVEQILEVERAHARELGGKWMQA